LLRTDGPTQVSFQGSNNTTDGVDGDWTTLLGPLDTSGDHPEPWVEWTFENEMNYTSYRLADDSQVGFVVMRWEMLPCEPVESNTTLTGNFTIENNLDLAFVRPYREITGNLVVTKVMGLTSVDLPNLQSLGGTLYIWENEELEEISFRSLTTIGGSLNIGLSPLVTTLAFPLLRQADKGLEILYLDGIDEIAFPELVTIGETGDAPGYLGHPPRLQIQSNAAVTGLSFPLLSTISARLQIKANTSLTDLVFPSLTNLTTEYSLPFQISGNHCLATEPIEALRVALGLEIDQTSVSDNLDSGLCEF